MPRLKRRFERNYKRIIIDATTYILINNENRYKKSSSPFWENNSRFFSRRIWNWIITASRALWHNFRYIRRYNEIDKNRPCKSTTCNWFTFIKSRGWILKIKFSVLTKTKFSNRINLFEHNRVRNQAASKWQQKSSYGALWYSLAWKFSQWTWDKLHLHRNYPQRRFLSSIYFHQLTLGQRY